MSRQIQDLDELFAIEAEGIDLVTVEDIDIPRTKKMKISELAVIIHDMNTPIGSTYTNVEDPTNPTDLLGFGVWEAYASGRMLVGIDPTQTEFASAGQTGGAKTVALTAAQNGRHAHGVHDPGHSHPMNLTGSNSEVVTNARDIEWSHAVDTVTRWTGHVGTGIGIHESGDGAPHQNMSPYVTVYIWRRTG